jgi:hypothetical protein
LVDSYPLRALLSRGETLLRVFFDLSLLVLLDFLVLLFLELRDELDDPLEYEEERDFDEDLYVSEEDLEEEEERLRCLRFFFGGVNLTGDGLRLLLTRE